MEIYNRMDNIRTEMEILAVFAVLKRRWCSADTLHPPVLWVTIISLCMHTVHLLHTVNVSGGVQYRMDTPTHCTHLYYG